MGKELKGTGWLATETTDGIRNVTCQSWGGYVSFLNEELVHYKNYIFRGHAHDEWVLEPTLDRALKGTPGKDQVLRRSQHLQNFKYASRGRRGHNPSLPTDENDWWALGQHHGMATPLLDWSESPYVAAYFAFYKMFDEQEPDSRIVYALSRTSVERKTRELIEKAGPGQNQGLIQFVRPMSDENLRLITQRGLFTRAPDNDSIEAWVKRHFKQAPGGAKLLRISVPNAERLTAMKNLNRMNINHLSLFPDIYGAAKHCNNDLLIDKY